MKRRKANGGFTLVEIAVAVLVIGIGFAALLSVFTVGLKWAQDVRKQTTLGTIARIYTDAPIPDPNPTVDDPDIVVNVPHSVMGYWLKVTRDDDPDPDVLTIEVYPTETHRDNGEQILATLVTQALE